MSTGRIGESLFELWCNEAELLPNPCKHDEAGWDFIVQFPPTTSPPPGIPADLAPNGPACLVQVKTTKSKQKNHVNIELSNWKHLVDIDAPCFVVFITLNSRNRPTSARIAHVDRDLGGRVLRRVRQADLDGNADRLHKLTMRHTFTDDQHLDVDGGNLRASLARFASEPGYAVSKSKWRAAVGYGDFRKRLSFTMGELTEDVAYTKMVDWAIGVTPKLAATVTRITDERFGLPIELPLPGVGGGTVLTLPSLPDIGQAELTFRGRGLETTLLATCFSPLVVFPDLPLEHLRLRFVAPGASFVLHWQEKRWDFHFDAGGEHETLAEVVARMKAVSAIADACERDGAFELILEMRGQKVPLSMKPPPPSDGGGFWRYARAVRTASRLLEAVGADQHVSVQALGLWQNVPALVAAAIFLEGRSDHLTEWEVSVLAGEFKEGAVYGQPTCIHVRLGDEHLVVAGAISGAAHVAPGAVEDADGYIRVRHQGIRVHQIAVGRWKQEVVKTVATYVDELGMRRFDRVMHIVRRGDGLVAKDGPIDHSQSARQ